MVTLKVFRSVFDIPVQHWEKLASGKSVNLEVNHLKAVELSEINHIKPYYFLGYADGQPIGIAYCFVMNVDLSRISNRFPAKTLGTLKTWNPGFMVLKLIEVGHLASLGSTIEVQKAHIREFLEAFSQETDRIAREEEADLCLVRDIPCGQMDGFTPLEDNGFVRVMGYPTASIECRWPNFEGYLLDLKSKKRNAFLQKRKALDRPEISVEIIDNYAPYADRLAELWGNVAKRNNGYDHEKLTPEYFVAMSENLRGRSHVVAIKRFDEIVAFGLNLIGDEDYFGMAEGMDYAWRDNYELYANTFFECIKAACKLGKKSIGLGITAYDYKASLGAEFHAAIYYVKAYKNPDYTTVYADFISESILQPENHHRCFRDTGPMNRVGLKQLNDSLVKQRDPSDVFDKHYRYTRIDFARATGLYSYCPEFECAQDPVVRHKGRNIIMLGTNSYLGLATRSEMKAAAIAAIEKYGTGCSGSPLLNGTLDIHKQLTNELADFFEQEAALVFSTGYQTNLGVVSALVNRNDYVIMDERNHASLVDGALLSRAKIIRYKHNDLASIEETLQKYKACPKLLVTDSIFSMEGTMIDLPAIVELARKYQARIMLDESHAIGVIGPQGKGVADYYGLLDKVDIIMGTFSKSLASVGGFVAGDRKIIDMLCHKSRSHIFSASLPPASVAAVREALNLVRNEPELRMVLKENASCLAEGLRNLGYRIDYYGGAIISVYCGHELIALSAFGELFKRGVFVNPVTSPAVPKQEEMLRISLMATHKKDMLNDALEVFKQIKTPFWPE